MKFWVRCNATYITKDEIFHHFYFGFYKFDLIMFTVGLDRKGNLTGVEFIWIFSYPSRRG